MNWPDYFFRICETVALKSKDLGTKVGAVIVGEDHQILSTGYNGFPRTIRETEERLEKPLKYFYTEHAEKNAIFNAARSGVCLNGSTLFIQWFPCHECVRAIINSGIRVVFVDKKFYNSRGEGGFEESFKHSKIMLEEAGLTVYFYEREKDEECLLT